MIDNKIKRLEKAIKKLDLTNRIKDVKHKIGQIAWTRIESALMCFIEHLAKRRPDALITDKDIGFQNISCCSPPVRKSVANTVS